MTYEQKRKWYSIQVLISLGIAITQRERAYYILFGNWEIVKEYIGKIKVKKGGGNNEDVQTTKKAT